MIASVIDYFANLPDWAKAAIAGGGLIGLFRHIVWLIQRFANLTRQIITALALLSRKTSIMRARDISSSYRRDMRLLSNSSRMAAYVGAQVLFCMYMISPSIIVTLYAAIEKYNGVLVAGSIFSALSVVYIFYNVIRFTDLAYGGRDRTVVMNQVRELLEKGGYGQDGINEWMKEYGFIRESK